MSKSHNSNFIERSVETKQSYTNRDLNRLMLLQFVEGFETLCRVIIVSICTKSTVSQKKTSSEV